MEEHEQPSEAAQADPVPDPGLDKLVGDKLRAHFDNLARSPVPDTIVALLQSLKAKEKQSDEQR